MSPDFDQYVAVLLPTPLVAELLRRSPHGINQLVANVVEDFLDRTADDFQMPMEKIGVFWESLFLPHGTMIRTKYFGEYKIAQINNETITWDGDTYPSFAQLANSMRGDTMNNAWQVLQIKRPTDTAWYPAQSLRR